MFWRLGPDRSGRAVLAEGRLFHYARPGEPWLVARAARDGRVRWSARLDGGGDGSVGGGDGSVGSDGAVAGWPAVADDAVVTAGRQLSAFGVESGDREWSQDLGVPETSDRLPESPAIVESTVVVGVPGRESGAVRAYGLGDGTHRWTTTLPNRGARVAVDDGVVVAVSGSFGSGKSVARALSLDGGDEQWSTTVPGDAARGPVVAGGAVYVSSDGVVRALSLADGEELWRRSFDGAPADLAADGERVFVGAGETLAVLGASDGSIHWTAASRDHSFGTPAVGADAVYAGTEGANGRLFAFDASDGTELWTQPFPATVVAGDVATAGVVAQPTVADGAVYVPAVDGLYAVGGESAEA